MTDFKSLNLAAPVHKALEKLGYETPTPIQLKAIPDVLKGRDLMGIAQTGTGKTAAFSLPMLSHIADNPKDPPKRGTRVLILAPTRELASQIEESVAEYGVCLPWLRTAVVFGGVPISKQIKKLVRGNDVLVATPGRLMDLMDRKDVRLNEVEILILDEADQMMDMGFIHALKKIIPHLPKERQTLFFSATMTPKIKNLAKQFLTDPLHVSVAPPNTTAEKVDQSMIFVNKNEKQDLLAVTLLDPSIERALVFTRTKHGADRVVKKLARVGMEALAIHCNKSQNNRQRALKKFKEGEIRFLIATDVAARGIDIEGITHVINFEIPNVPEQYVHRIGRTARAGREGRAIAFVDKEERDYLKDIQKLLKVTIPVAPLPEDFLRKVKEVNKRTPLPQPERPEGYESHQDPRRKRFKKKKPKSASDEMKSDAGKSDSKKSKDPYKSKSWSNKSSGGKPSGGRSDGGKPRDRTATEANKKWDKRDKKTGASDSAKPEASNSGEKSRKYSTEKPSWQSRDKPKFPKSKKRPQGSANNNSDKRSDGDRSSSGTKPSQGKPQSKQQWAKPYGGGGGKPGSNRPSGGDQAKSGNKSFKRKPRSGGNDSGRR